jgi:hypothetical protein
MEYKCTICNKKYDAGDSFTESNLITPSENLICNKCLGKPEKPEHRCVLCDELLSDRSEKICDICYKEKICKY